jgi:hypothetical protein
VEVEDIATALEEPLTISVDWYDRDSKDYIDELYGITVQITVGFSLGIVAYYMFVLRIILTRLGKMMCEEFRFRAILPKTLDDATGSIQGSVESQNAESVDTTKAGQALYSS